MDFENGTDKNRTAEGQAKVFGEKQTEINDSFFDTLIENTPIKNVESDKEDVKIPERKADALSEDTKLALSGLSAAMDILNRYDDEEEDTEAAEEAQEETLDAEAEIDGGSDDDVKIFGGGSTHKPITEKKPVSENSGKEPAKEVGFSMFEEEEDPEPEEAYLSEEAEMQADENEADGACDRQTAPETESEPSETEPADKSARRAEASDEANSDDDPLAALYSSQVNNGEKKDKRNKRGRHAEKKQEKKQTPWEEIGLSETIDMKDPDSVEKAHRKFVNRKNYALISMVGVFIMFLLSLYAELAPISGFLPHSSLMSSDNPAVFALIDLQLMCFAVMFMTDSLSKGFETWVDRRVFTPAAAAITVTAAAGIQAIATAVLCRSGDSVRLFCSIGCASLAMLALYERLTASADKRSFNVVCLKNQPKLGAVELDADSKDCAPFRETLAIGNARAITVGKAKYCARFAERTGSIPDCERKLWIVAAAAAVIAVVVGVISGGAQTSLYTGISSAVLVYVSSMPLNIFLVSALPRNIATKQGKKIDATLIGPNAASDDFKRLSVVTFEDTELFTVDSRRTVVVPVDNARIIDVAVMKKIFNYIGGPFCHAFDRIVTGIESSSDVKLIKVYPNAIEAMVDGEVYFVATDKYLAENKIRFRKQSGGAEMSVLHLVKDGECIATCRIPCKINQDVEETIKALHDEKLRVGIKTVTPGIDDKLIYDLTDFRSPVYVIRGNAETDAEEAAEEVDSGIIAHKSAHRFLKMLLICAATGRKIKVNTGIAYVSAAFCAVLAFWFIIFNNAHIGVEFGMLIQLFWLIPVAVISYFAK